MHGVSIYHINDVKRRITNNETELEDGSWVLARPLGLGGFFWRLKCAWMIFRGKGHIVTFTNQ